MRAAAGYDGGRMAAKYCIKFSSIRVSPTINLNHISKYFREPQSIHYVSLCFYRNLPFLRESIILVDTE